jgi:hypothetical protein
MHIDDLYMDRDSQVAAIEKTFEDALRPITTHYSKPHIHPVEVMPVLPDSNMWKYPCAQVRLESFILPFYSYIRSSSTLTRRRRACRRRSRWSRWARR